MPNQSSAMKTTRILKAKELKEARMRDRASSLIGAIIRKKGAEGWRGHFNSGLFELNQAYQLDLVNEILEHRKMFSGEYRVLDLGCGNGKGSAELEQKVGGIAEIHATGTAIIPEWKKHANSKKINWHVGDAEKLLKRIGPNSLNFIHANLSIGVSQFLWEAIAACEKMLKPHGRLLFTTEHILPSTPPEGFKYKKPPILDRRFKVYYLEKL